MTETIVSSLITGIVAISICMINNAFNRKDSEKRHQATVERIEYRLESLTKQVEKHNSVIERTYKLEQDVAVLNSELDNLKHE